VLGGDGRYFNDRAGAGDPADGGGEWRGAVIVGQGAILSTPARAI